MKRASGRRRADEHAVLGADRVRDLGLVAHVGPLVFREVRRRRRDGRGHRVMRDVSVRADHVEGPAHAFAPELHAHGPVADREERFGLRHQRPSPLRLQGAPLDGHARRLRRAHVAIEPGPALEDGGGDGEPETASPPAPARRRGQPRPRRERNRWPPRCRRCTGRPPTRPDRGSGSGTRDSPRSSRNG